MNKCCNPVTPLRQKMIDLLDVKNLAKSTKESYLYGVASLARHYGRSPDQVSEADVQAYILYLVRVRQLAPSSCRLQLQGIRFFYQHVLHKPTHELKVHFPKKATRIPDLLTRGEALSIVNASDNIKHQCQLKLCYACGLRISEVVSLRVRDIDGERKQLKVECGKGMKDRFVPMSDELLYQLRVYWQAFKPSNQFFYNTDPDVAMSPSSIGKLYTRSKALVGVNKAGGVHALRHAFATHQLEAGLPIHLLQRWLGHKDIQTTMQYIHWVPNYQGGLAHFSDLLGES